MEDWIWIDSKKAFNEAIVVGILSDNEGDKNFVGDFLWVILCIWERKKECINLKIL